MQSKLQSRSCDSFTDLNCVDVNACCVHDVDYLVLRDRLGYIMIIVCLSCSLCFLYYCSNICLINFVRFCCCQRLCVSLSSRIKALILEYRGSLVLELQQRAIEFGSILTKHNDIKLILLLVPIPLHTNIIKVKR